MIRIAKHLLLPIGKEETPPSYTSRVAMDRGLTVWTFAELMGTSFPRIVHGEPGALRALSETCYLDCDALADGAFVRVSKFEFRHRGQHFTRAALTRAELRVCPLCIRKDLATDSGDRRTRIYSRACWNIAAVRACPTHNVELVTVSNEAHASQTHDFATRIAKALPVLGSLPLKAAPHSRSEAYLIGRLNGQRAGIWLDDLPFHAAAKICDVLGAVERYGIRAAWRDLTATQWRAANASGFDIASGGPEAIDDWLGGLTRTFFDTQRHWGLKLLYGRLYEWLSHDCRDVAFDPLRRIMHDHIVLRLPVGPRDKIFSWPVERRLHSVFTLHRQTKLPIVGIRRLGEAMGVLEDNGNLTDDRLLMTVKDADRLVKRMQDGLTLAGVTERLNLPRGHEKLLHDAGFIRPLFNPNQLSQYLFDKHEIDSFWQKITARLKPQAEPDMVTIMKASKLAKCQAMEIIQLLVDGKLERLAMEPGGTGYKSLLVCPKEIAPFVRGKQPTGLTLKQVEYRLHTPSRVINKLLDGNYLRSTHKINAINRCPQRMVEVEDLEEFMQTYISVSELSRRSGIGMRGVKARLDRAALKPAFDPEIVRASFYRRDEVPPLS